MIMLRSTNVEICVYFVQLSLPVLSSTYTGHHIIKRNKYIWKCIPNTSPENHTKTKIINTFENALPTPHLENHTPDDLSLLHTLFDLQYLY